MAFPLRFLVLALPNTNWTELVRRYQHVESAGYDIAATADHFVDWTNPPAPWFELWTHTAALAALTSRVRIATLVAQIPLRSPAMFARSALALDHISGGRFEAGLGIGLPIDPSYAMIGLDNWTPKERVDRFSEYVEIVDRMLSNEVTSYAGEYDRIENAYMNPRPVQQPRPPLLIAAMGKRMLRIAARQADIWNSLSFAPEFEQQLAETAERVAIVDRACERAGRDPATLRRSYLMFDPKARASGGAFAYYESPERFREMAERVIALGVTDIGLYYPALPEQHEVFDRIGREIIPELKARHG
ncbi:MAG: LLM class flavin-dependent oxidoreductase [Ectothiorhodospiraceae bacterium]|nr:LLM class flavin-dependent oxidoreductase [Ectothiorhodospiraceae bacterium]